MVVMVESPGCHPDPERSEGEGSPAHVPRDLSPSARLGMTRAGAILLDNQRQMRRLAVPLLVFTFCLLLSVFCFFFHRDNFSTHYPIKAVSAAAFRAGEIP